MLVRWISSVRLFPLSFSLWCVHMFLSPSIPLRFLFTPHQQIDFAFYFLLHLISSQEKDAFSLPINLTIILTTWGWKKSWNRWLLKWEIDIYFIDSAKLFTLPHFHSENISFLVIYMAHESSVWVNKKRTFFWEQRVCAFGNSIQRQQHTHMTSGYEKGIFFAVSFFLRHETNATKTKQKKTKSCFHSPNTLPSSSFMGFNDIESPAHKSNHHLTFSNPFHFPSIKNNMRMNEKISFTKHFNGHSAKASTKNTTFIQCEVFCKIKFNGHNVAKSSNPIRLNDKHFAHPQKQHTHC